MNFKKLLLMVCLVTIGLIIGTQKARADLYCGTGSTCQDGVWRNYNVIFTCNAGPSYCIENYDTGSGLCHHLSGLGCPGGTGLCCGFQYNKWKCGAFPSCPSVSDGMGFYSCCTGDGGGGGGGSLLVNCSNLTVSGGSTLTKGETYSLGADYDFSGHLQDRQMVAWMHIIQGTTCPTSIYKSFFASNAIVGYDGGGNPIYSNSPPTPPVGFSWTPTAAGTYTIYCGTSAAGYAACRGFDPNSASNNCDPTTDYVCSGPGASRTVVVIDPKCTLALAPATASVNVGNATNFTTTTTVTDDTITGITFSSSNGHATVNPTSDTTPPFTTSATTATGVSTGTAIITATATTSLNKTCTDTSTLTVTAVPSCTVTLPATDSIAVGQTKSLTATTSVTSDTISRVDFSSSTGNVTVNPTFITTPPLVPSVSTNEKGISSGNSVVTATATLSLGGTCSDNTTVTVLSSDPWWQVKDGDVTTNGNLDSTVPPTAGLYFDTIGGGGYPGIPAYGGSTSTLTGANVSVNEWLANSGYNATKIYNSGYFLNAIPAGTVINSLASSINGTAISSGGTATNGIYWYEYDPASYGGADLTINTVASLGTRKVVLIAKGADVYLNGKINLSKGSGFFLLVAGETAGGTKGNIIVDPAVGGGGAANLEGIYVADGEFQSGIAATQLWVRGTVAAYGGISLQRDLGATNSTTPSELFEYAPDLEILFPGELATHAVNWQEVAP